jgi:hypothetical protein
VISAASANSITKFYHTAFVVAWGWKARGGPRRALVSPRPLTLALGVGPFTERAYGLPIGLWLSHIFGAKDDQFNCLLSRERHGQQHKSGEQHRLVALWISGSLITQLSACRRTAIEDSVSIGRVTMPGHGQVNSSRQMVSLRARRVPLGRSACMA